MMLFTLMASDGTGSQHFGTLESVIEKLSSIANNGDYLVQGNSERGDYQGLFYGKGKQKWFYSRNYLRGEFKKWVHAACDSIGDQSSLDELMLETQRQAWKFERVKPNGLSFYYFQDLAEIATETPSALSLYRKQWRTKHGIKRDCRTYSGQPRRNMVLQ